MSPLSVSCLYWLLSLLRSLYTPPRHKGERYLGKTRNGTSVLILGGGVSSIIAARILNENGITDFKIVGARDEFGGRLRSISFGTPGKQKTVEVIPPPPNQLHLLTLVSQLGANWVQGTGGEPDLGARQETRGKDAVQCVLRKLVCVLQELYLNTTRPHEVEISDF